MQEQPDITVVITTIPSRGLRLAKAYASVEAQTLQPKEIVVQMDTQKLGAPGNRDNGVARVTTEWVAFLDDDDYFYPQHLETLYKAAIENDADIVYSWFDVEGGTDPFPENFGKPFDPENPVQTTVTTLCKTQVVRDAGGFSNTIGLNEEELESLSQGNTVGEDFRLILSAVANGAKVHHVAERTWAYVHWNGNTSGRPDRVETPMFDYWSAGATPKISIVVPSRGRPENAHRLLKAINDTAKDHVTVTFAVDKDDDTISQYPQDNVMPVTGGSMVNALNEQALTEAHFYPYVGFLGDDTLPHDGWYPKIIWALERQDNSIVYGNDLIQGENLPTGVFMDSNIVKTLGFMAPVNQKQLFVDNFWKLLGEELGTLTYVDDAIIEHLHPLAEKAPHDATYEHGNSSDVWEHDAAQYRLYKQTDFAKDVKKLTNE